MSKIQVLVAASFISALTISCQKESVDQHKPIQSKIECEFDNPDNIYDSEGSEHNRILDDIVSVVGSGSSLHEITAVADSIAEEEGLGSDYDSEEWMNEVGDAITNSGDLDIEGFAEGLTDKSALEKDLVEDLLTIVANYDGTNECDIISQITSFETNIQDDYPNQDLQYILEGSSVARHSVAYWSDDEDYIDSAPAWVGALADLGGYFLCGGCAPFVSALAEALYDAFF